MMVTNHKAIATDAIEIVGVPENARLLFNKLYDKEGVCIFDLTITANSLPISAPITLQWKFPAHNVKGVWKPSSDFAKRIQPDWEMEDMESRISIDAPVVCLFGHDDSNIHTFACSEAIATLLLNAKIREEDHFFYCSISLSNEASLNLHDVYVRIRIDSGKRHFSEALSAVSSWWETFEHLKPIAVPEIAKKPLYSTWYQFHQNIDTKILLDECKIARKLGYDALIIDDGWQTKDTNRGYDYTGDWNPDRIPETKDFVARIHDIGMKVGFWYAVPFCGKKSRAYRRFQGKFLTENHRWAPVLDPRFPEVRTYLVDIYRKALIEWDLDGFKLDFIDDFKVYPDTVMVQSKGMDFASINKAVDCLLTEIISTLKGIRTAIFIEFRQKYTGPAMRKYGTMFRAFDCPGDATMNRVRITDIRMLAGNTAVHSDMITWHKEETVEVAALQMLNTLFGVPQLSVMLHDLPEDHLKMIAFYTQYWKQHKDAITTGYFIPSNPLANYPVQQVVKQELLIIGIYDDRFIAIHEKRKHIHIINAKLSTTIILKANSYLGVYDSEVFNCKGQRQHQSNVVFDRLLALEVPACGMVKLTLKN